MEQQDETFKDKLNREAKEAEWKMRERETQRILESQGKKF